MRDPVREACEACLAEIQDPAEQGRLGFGLTAALLVGRPESGAERLRALPAQLKVAALRYRANTGHPPDEPLAALVRHQLGQPPLAGSLEADALARWAGLPVSLAARAPIERMGIIAQCHRWGVPADIGEAVAWLEAELSGQQADLCRLALVRQRIETDRAACMALAERIEDPGMFLEAGFELAVRSPGETSAAALLLGRAEKLAEAGGPAALAALAALAGRCRAPSAAGHLERARALLRSPPDELADAAGRLFLAAACVGGQAWAATVAGVSRGHAVKSDEQLAAECAYRAADSARWLDAPALEDAPRVVGELLAGLELPAAQALVAAVMAEISLTRGLAPAGLLVSDLKRRLEGLVGARAIELRPYAAKLGRHLVRCPELRAAGLELSARILDAPARARVLLVILEGS